MAFPTTTSRRWLRTCGRSRNNDRQEILRRVAAGTDVEKPDAFSQKACRAGSAPPFPIAVCSGGALGLPAFAAPVGHAGGGGDKCARQAGQFGLPGLPHRPVQHPHGERAKSPAARLPDEQLRPVGPCHARLHGLPHGGEGAGPRRQPAAAGLLRVPRQGGKGLCDEHPRHEPRAGRLRRGELLGLPRGARYFAGQGPGVAGLQNEPAADVREVSQQCRARAGIRHQASRGGGAIPGQHPRAGAAEDGADRCAVVQRLPRRPRHQASGGPRFAGEPRARRRDLRQVPSGD